MGALKTKVQIDGITIWDDSDAGAPDLLINWEYERTGTDMVSMLRMNTIKTINDTVELVVGKTVSIWKGFTTSTDIKMFEGFIADFEPDGGIIRLTCKDKMWDLVRRNVNRVYLDSDPQAGEISAIAEDMIETYGGLTADVVATGTGTTEIIKEFKCIHADIFERLKALADAVRYQFWYDAVNDTVHFEPHGYNASAQTLTAGENILGVPKWFNDTSKMINDLRVDGAVALTQIRKPVGTGYGTIGTTADFDTTGILLDKTPESVELIFDASTPPITVKEGGTEDSTAGNFYYMDKEAKTVRPATGTTFATQNAIINYNWFAPVPIHQINQQSIDDYGKFEKEITLSDIQTIADVEVRTAEILSKFSQPFLIGELMIISGSTTDVNLGDTVTVVDNINSPNINQTLVVTKQVIKYPATNQELTVGDEGIRLADWQLNVETRLKRIEELLTLSNQDLVLELVDIQNIGKTVVPRYRQVTSRVLAGDGFVLSHPSYGILGTSTLGDDSAVFTDDVVMQYENTYDEPFTDEDFESTNTTATWGTSGSVSFTSGQIAESNAIDFDNGTITQAKLTSTETSGSFDYEMTANGSDWEAVTSGTTHTFTDTGTDLRWRATENSATTGEISNMTVENYH